MIPITGMSECVIRREQLPSVTAGDVLCGEVDSKAAAPLPSQHEG